MDEALKRRLVGAAVVLGVAFLLSLMLPKPTDPAGDASGVTIDLTQPDVPADPYAAPAPLPAPAPAPDSAAEAPATTAIAAASDAELPPDDAPQIETPADTPEPIDAPKPEAPKPVETPKPVKPEPVVIAPATPAKPPASIKPAPVADKPAPTKPAPVKAGPAVAAVKPEPVKAAPATPAKPPVAAAAAPAATKSGSWYVQAGSFTDINNARKLLDRAQGKGVISPVETASGISYRLRLGPYASKEKAVTERDRLAPGGAVRQD